MLNLPDGTASPKQYYDDWTGVRLVDEEANEDIEPFNDMLHDSFFEIYREWEKLRGDKG